MTLQINNHELEKLANVLASRTGETPTEALLNAVRHQIQAHEATTMAQYTKASKEVRLKKARAIVKSIRALPVVDPRSPDAILGYDENGLPT